MTLELESFPSIDDVVASRPAEPVYCLFPDVYEQTARRFVEGFPGRVLYAVKANDHPFVIRSLAAGGVRHFDCASLDEIERVTKTVPDATCYFMTPVRLRGAARTAQREYGTRHFLVDHADGVDLLAGEIDMSEAVVFARMAVSHASAMVDLSKRFGAPPDDIAAILDAIHAAGAEPALAFNVGSAVISTDAYRHSLDAARRVLEPLARQVRLVDIGGGFPLAYPGFEVPPLEAYFDTVSTGAAALPLAEGAELLAEPGRALAGPGMSAIVEVRLRKGQRLYLNDGMYGVFWELRFKGHERYAVRAFREGRALEGESAAFRVYGPTCDSTDELPGSLTLPAGIRPGDHLEFGEIGAYSLAGRTRFNGFHSERIVAINGGRPVS